jgi:hypothetical protein
MISVFKVKSNSTFTETPKNIRKELPRSENESSEKRRTLRRNRNNKQKVDSTLASTTSNIESASKYNVTYVTICNT